MHIAVMQTKLINATADLVELRKAAHSALTNPKIERGLINATLHAARQRVIDIMEQSGVDVMPFTAANELVAERRMQRKNIAERKRRQRERAAQIAEELRYSL